MTVKRIDNREPSQLRVMNVVQGLLSRPDGSAKFTAGLFFLPHCIYIFITFFSLFGHHGEENIELARLPFFFLIP